MTLAPIVLFVYNRPWHTEQTLNALMQNELADQSVLYIYADGPKPNATPEQLQKISEVREVIKSKRWCKEVHIIESEKNKGLADSIVDGVTEIVNQYGRIIVLEDDIVTSSGFLKYMNDALTFYSTNEKVMHISGYMYPLIMKSEEDTLFLNVVTPWGWATWASRWKYFDNDAKILLQNVISKPGFSEDKFNVGYGREFTKQLMANVEGTLKTWAVKWHSCIYLKSGYCLHPSKSLTKNIGMDNSGENCVATNIYDVNLCGEVKVKKISIVQKEKTLNAFIDFYKMQNRKQIKKRLTFMERIKKLIT